MSRKIKYKHSATLTSQILKTLAEYPKGATAITIAKKMKLPKSQTHLVWKILGEQEKLGDVNRKRKNHFYLKSISKTYIGTFIRKIYGSGDVIAEDKDIHIRLSRNEAFGLVDGDRIEVNIKPHNSRKIIQGRLQRIVSSRKDPVIGYFQKSGNGGIVTPLNPKIAKSIYIPSKEISGCRNKQIIAVLVDPPSQSKKRRTGKIQKIIGKRNDLGVDSTILVYNHGLRESFPANSIKEAKQHPRELQSQHIQNRKDIRSELVITVDPVSASDFDDGLSLTRLSKGYRLGVHIADVSHFVEPGSLIDKEAYLRGTSTYFPERTVHMLPEYLATDICSLRPNQDRLTMTVWINMDFEGNITSGRCEPTVIRSKARLNYGQFLAASMGQQDQEIKPEIATLCVQLTHVCSLLLKKRVERGVLDLDMPEVNFEFNPSGKLVGIHKKQRSIAEQSIEEFMIAANVVVAEFLDRKKVSYLRRIHKSPDPSTVTDLRQSLMRLGINPPSNPLDPDKVRTMLSAIKSDAIRSVASQQILRCMKRAVYSPEKIGHFGLALSAYTQFTSPIRRYPDLQIHRMVKTALGFKTYHITDGSQLESQAQHLSDRERSTQEAEWDAIKLQKIRFMNSKIGIELTGTITNVEKFGAFVEIEEPFVEGLIPVRRLDGYYRYVEQENSLICSEHSVVLKAGTIVKIKTVLADIDRGMLDFTLVT